MKNYELDENAISSWVPWGGLVRSSVQRNKDGSFIGIINLVRSEQDSEQPFINIPFNLGWCMWHELQNFGKYKAEYIFITWNPMYVKKKTNFIQKIRYFFDMPKGRIIWNTLKDKDKKSGRIKEEDADKYFAQALEQIRSSLATRYKADILANEQIINALSSTVSMQSENYAMPETPLYFDVICTDVSFDMREYDIVINNKKMSIISLPSFHHFSTDFRKKLLDRLSELPFRFSMRVLLTDNKNAEAYLHKYTKSWCSNRNVARENIKKYMLKDINGFFSNVFVFFSESENELDRITEKAIDTFVDMGISYIVERRNYKAVWWSTLPGMFRAKEHYTISGCSMENYFDLCCSQRTTKIEQD